MAEAALRIAIDGRELLGRPTGVGRYLLETLRCWEASGRHEFTIIVPASPPDDHLGLSDRFAWVVEPSDSAGTLWEQWRLPSALRRLRPDVLFAPAYTAPLLAPCPVVQVIYDVSFFAHPEWFSSREGMRRRWITRASARRAAAVITISEFSRSEIAHHLDIPADQIVLAPPGPPPTSAGSPAPRLGLVLFVGSLFNRRRLPDMIGAFAEASKTVGDARLVLIGDNRTAPHLDPLQLASAAGVAGKVTWLEYANETVLTQMYDSARVFLFLSDYEGFALTPMEAIAHGVPAVLLDTPVSREIYGGAARLVPANRSLIAAALRELLTDDRAHDTLVQSGRAALARYSWQKSADLVLAALERAAR